MQEFILNSTILLTRLIVTARDVWSRGDIKMSVKEYLRYVDGAPMQPAPEGETISSRDLARIVHNNRRNSETVWKGCPMSSRMERLVTHRLFSGTSGA